jgi:hypothetical protein
MPSEEVKTEIFYSKSPGLVIWPEQSKRVIEDGQSKVIDGSPIRFTAIGDGFGYYDAKTPAEIAYLSDRAKRVGDIFDGAKFAELSTPDTVKLQQATRTIEDNNRLIADLQREIEQLRAKGGAPSIPRK